jgi:tryptophan synthase alpha subunit
MNNDTGSARIEGAIRNVTSNGHPALAAFLTAGFPEPETFTTVLQCVAEVADIVEVGVPFSDPMADGVTIQHSSRAVEPLSRQASLCRGSSTSSGNPAPQHQSC